MRRTGLRALWTLAVLLPLLLSACVLHSGAPLFAEADAVALLGAAPLSLTVATGPVAGLPARLALVPEGKHYRVVDPGAKRPMSLAFFPVGQDRHALQYTVANGQDYALATWDGARLSVTALDCARLKTDLRSNLLVQFSDNACTLRAPGDAVAAFALFSVQAPDGIWLRE